VKQKSSQGIFKICVLNTANFAISNLAGVANNFINFEKL
jgi:hypothetical protein